MFRALLYHHQGAHHNTKQLLNIFGSYMQKMLSNRWSNKARNMYELGCCNIIVILTRME